MTHDPTLTLLEDGKPVSRLDGTVPRFHPLTSEEVNRILGAVDRDLPMKSTEGLDEVAAEYYRRDYKAWRAQLQKNLFEQGMESAYGLSFRRLEVVVQAPQGSTVNATIDGPLQLMDAYDHVTSFYEEESMFQDPPEPPDRPVERQAWWGEEAAFGVGYYVPRKPYQLPQHLEWTMEEAEDQRAILIMVPLDAADEVQGTLRVQVRAEDGQSQEQELPVQLTGDWSKAGRHNAEGFAQIGVDLTKEG